MKKNILVFPCGSEIGLEIHNSLKFVKNIQLYGASSVSDHGKFVYKNYIENVPNVTNEEFIKELNKIIESYKIDFIFPAHDSVVLKLAECQKQLAAEVITSPAKTCQICRSKQKTYDYFHGEDFIPKTYEKAEDVQNFPVFLKPDVGQGSKGIAIAYNMHELKEQLKREEKLVISELMPGKEYTIDCFTDFSGRLRFSGMRERLRVKSGISVHSQTQTINDSIQMIAEKINQKLELRGVWFFQVKEDSNGEFKLLEIAPRIAGTMSVHRNKGINFALLSILDRMNMEIDVLENEFTVEVDRALINRFNLGIEYKKVYLDFDDTVTKDEQVNPYVMMFVYQCINKGIDVILVTKHIKDIKETLEELRIDQNLFTEVIHLKKEDEKYKFFSDVNENAAIFIDDAFSERKVIHDKLGVPVFDTDSIESLIDWRH